MEKMTEIEKLKHCLECIKRLGEEYAKKKFALDVERRDTLMPYLEAVEAVRSKYRNLVQDQAEKQGKCPRYRWGNFMTHDDVDLDEHAVTITWWNDEGADDTFEMSWAEIEAVMAAEKE